MVIINGENLILGRLSSFVASKLLDKEKVAIVNAEKVVVRGTKMAIMERFERRRTLQAKGNPIKGPKYYKATVNLVRFAVRGMLPYKRLTGKEAYRRLRVYVGLPKTFEGKEIITIEDAKCTKGRFLTISEISTRIGGKW
ncbi:MAG: 50S ribosomal protein L13 [Candidatus Diapherotrites archaeon CG08_land_8_20_14_0_20_34_12]|nr:MAG: 50S ribosomal protein L13 [Candidatus Diapherotrites archaeon CG08_land_8_20_14_0_20_34_12]